MSESLTRETHAKRDALWQKVGKVEPEVITHLVNPALMGAPRWPDMRQAYTVIREPNGNSIIATDGISDPFSDSHPHKNNKNGYEIEIYLETQENLQLPQHSWQFTLLYQTAQNVVNNGGTKELLDEIDYISLDLSAIPVPKEYLNQEGKAGVILGIPSKLIPDTIQLPLSEVSLVSITLLTPNELEFIMQHGEEGRNKIAQLIIEKYDGPVTSTTRTSVI